MVERLAHPVVAVRVHDVGLRGHRRHELAIEIVEQRIFFQRVEANFHIDVEQHDRTGGRIEFVEQVAEFEIVIELRREMRHLAVEAVHRGAVVMIEGAGRRIPRCFEVAVKLAQQVGEGVDQRADAVGVDHQLAGERAGDARDVVGRRVGRGLESEDARESRGLFGTAPCVDQRVEIVGVVGPPRDANLMRAAGAVVPRDFRLRVERGGADHRRLPRRQIDEDILQRGRELRMERNFALKIELAIEDGDRTRRTRGSRRREIDDRREQRAAVGREARIGGRSALTREARAKRRRSWHSRRS